MKEKTTEAQLKKALNELQERTKEQRCLYEISNLDETVLTTKEILQEACPLTKKGFQFPQLTNVSIELNDKM